MLKTWNAWFREQGMDAAMSKYPATEATLPERLSEMFHFDRRAYIVAPDLGRAVLPLLDRLDPAAKHTDSVRYITNTGGVLTGFASVPDCATAFLSPEPLGVDS